MKRTLLIDTSEFMLCKRCKDLILPSAQKIIVGVLLDGVQRFHSYHAVCWKVASRKEPI